MESIDVLANPPTSEAIASMRKAAGNSFDTAATVMFATPLPFVDLAVGAVAGGIDHLVNGAERERLEYAHDAYRRDWNDSPAAKAYVDKVRAQGRPLINAEVQALENHLKTERDIRHVIETGIDVISSVLKSKFQTA